MVRNRKGNHRPVRALVHHERQSSSTVSRSTIPPTRLRHTCLETPTHHRTLPDRGRKRNSREPVLEAVGQILRGMVTVYGTIARRTGRPRMARPVGWMLHPLPDVPEPGCLTVPGARTDGWSPVVTWHRVVNRHGCVALLPDPDERRVETHRRRSAGVEVSDDRTLVGGLARWSWVSSPTWMPPWLRPEPRERASKWDQVREHGLSHAPTPVGHLIRRPWPEPAPWRVRTPRH
ncbi:MAG: MGMT family protein [Chloroflexi bacterium]|nr:MGMT family protein [Chloroflexota bacterium]